MVVHPKITIDPDVTPEEFIDRLEELLSSSPRFPVVRSHKDSFCYGIGIQVIEDSRDNEQMLTLIADSEENHVEVTIMDRESEDIFSSFSEEEYRRIKKDVVSSIVELYNNAYEVSCKLHLQSVSPYTLPPKAEEVFKRFTKLASKHVIHPLDWQRFYEFVRFCNTHSVKLSPSRLHELLKEEGFSHAQSEHLADLYRHGRGMLSNKWFRLP